MNQRFRQADLRKLTLTASLAAAYTIFRVIPISGLVGLRGSITASGMVAPVLGVLLEPFYGMVAVFAGTMIASTISGNIPFYGLNFVPGALNVALVSLAVRGRRTEAIVLFLVVIGLFIVNPFTTTFVGITFVSPPLPYYWLHLVALVVLITPLSKGLALKLTSRNYPSLATAIVVLAFTGTMIEHLTGGILFASIIGTGALKLWPVIFIVYPVERTIIVLGAVLICTPLVNLLKSTIQENLRREVQVLSSSIPPLSSRSLEKD